MIAQCCASASETRESARMGGAVGKPPTSVRW
jgi:hypothetical protein